MTSERSGPEGMGRESAGLDGNGSARLSLITVGAEVDADSLLAEIQRDVERKKEAGLYPPALMAELELLHDPLEWSLDGLVRSAKLEQEPRLASHHRIVGGASVLAKRFLRRGARWYTRWLVDQLFSFSGAVVQMSAALKERSEEQQSATEELRAEFVAERARVRHQIMRINRRLEPLLQAEASGPAPPTSARNGRTDSMLQSQGGLAGIDLVDFRDRVRPRAETVRRQSLYLDFFRRSPGHVLDLGCGSGDFLALLRQAGIDAHGVDANPDMVARCQEMGLEVALEDPLAHLARLPSGTLGGVCAAGVVEHLEPAAVVRLFQLAAEVLGEGGVFVVETLNPQSVATLTSAAFADLLPARPIDPRVLTYLAESSGFRDIELRYLESQNDRLPAPSPPADGESIDSVLGEMIENLRRIDSVLFGAIDLALIAHH
ncbi:MAG: class I SAM-dependent methyltransferase [Acidimicrobiaceae bacterium]|nr:class I SAM-dependent methyltransferase [Acidimicrobiaceae bacterium]